MTGLKPQKLRDAYETAKFHLTLTNACPKKLHVSVEVGDSRGRRVRPPARARARPPDRSQTPPQVGLDDPASERVA